MFLSPAIANWSQNNASYFASAKVYSQQNVGFRSPVNCFLVLFKVKTTDDVLNKVEFAADEEAIWGSG